MNDQDTKTIYASYSYQDFDFVNLILEQLTKLTLKIVPKGPILQGEILTNFQKQSSGTIAFLSNNSRDSKQFGIEIAYASERAKVDYENYFFIPVILDEDNTFNLNS